MNNLQKRIFTSIVLIAIVLSCLFVSSVTWSILLLIVSVTALYEFFFLIKKIYLNKKQIEDIFVKFLFWFLSGWYLAIFFSTAQDIRELKGEFFVLFILLIIIFSDVGGYIVGKIIGGVKLTKISPNKTISGSLGSFLFSLIPFGLIVLIINFINFSEINNLGEAIWRLYLVEYREGFISVIVLCLSLSFVSQIGDLIISYFKRLAKVKDTGKFLPGHGGILDRIDGIIFAVPFYYFFWIKL
mgnify:CR=1 FL=1